MPAKPQLLPVSMDAAELKQTIATYRNTQLNLRARAEGMLKEADAIEPEVKKLEAELKAVEKTEPAAKK